MIKCPNPKCKKMWGWCFAQDRYLDEKSKNYSHIVELTSEDSTRPGTITIHQCTCGEILGATHENEAGACEYETREWKGIDWEQHSISECVEALPKCEVCGNEVCRLCACCHDPKCPANYPCEAK